MHRPTQSRNDLRVPRHLNPHVVHCVFAFGGICAMIFAAFLRFRNVLFFALDNPKELNLRRDFYRLHNVTPIPLAFGHTLQSLAESTDHPAGNAISQVGNANAAIGLAALVGAGGMAGKLLVESREFRQIREQCRADIFKLTGGAPQGVYHHVFLGLGGATASGAAEPTTCSFVEMYAGLEIPVEVHYHAVGQIAMTGLSERAPLNDPAARLAYINRVTSPAPSRVSNHLHLLELPPLGPNAKETRDAILQAQYKAIYAHQLNDYVEMVAPNYAGDSLLGNIDFRSFELLQNPASTSAISECSARLMRDEFKETFKSAVDNPSLIQSEEWLDQAASVDSVSIDRLVETSWRDARILHEKILVPTNQYDPRLVIAFRSIGRIDTSATDQYCSKPIKTVEEAFERKTVLATLSTYLKRHQQAAERQAAIHTTSIEARMKSVYDLVRTATKKISQRKRLQLLDKLRIVLMEIRDFNEKRTLQRARVEALRVAVEISHTEAITVNQKLDSIDNSLADCVSALGPSDSRQLVINNTIGDAMKTLAELPKYSRDLQLSMLNRMAAFLTRPGLQLIAHAEHPNIESIAEAIVFGTPTYKSPPLGAKTYFQHDATIYFIPPIELHDRKALSEEIVKLDATAIVFYGDDIDCGAAVLKFRFRRFEDIESMFPGVLKHDLLRALGSRLPELRFPNGFDFLGRLGIRFDSDQNTLDFGPFPPSSDQ